MSAQYPVDSWDILRALRMVGMISVPWTWSGRSTPSSCQELWNLGFSRLHAGWEQEPLLLLR